MEKFFYRVENKDTLFSVCQKFQVAPTVLIKLNGLNKEISSGDLLYIEKQVGNFYAVQPFDTIESLANRFMVDKEKILSDNGVSYIFYGLIIKI